MEFLFVLSLFLSSVLCIEILYDGRAKPNFDAGVLDKSSGPYLTYAIHPFDGAPTERSYAVPSGDPRPQATYVLQNLDYLLSGVLTADQNPVYSIHPRRSFPNAALERPIQ